MNQKHEKHGCMKKETPSSKKGISKLGDFIDTSDVYIVCQSELPLFAEDSWNLKLYIWGWILKVKFITCQYTCH